MIPIENSQAGRVAEIHNLLPRTELNIVAEHIQPVEHHIYALPGTKLEDVTSVYSHHMALLQCRDFITGNGMETFIHGNTATAARDVKAWGEGAKAAICSKLAGELYQLELLAENIEDAEDNETLFVTMAKEAVDAREALKGMPTLIKGYLRLGGMIGDGAVVDYSYNTTDVSIIVRTDAIGDKYTERYQSS